jgi:Uma2 family endonuclease
LGDLLKHLGDVPADRVRYYPFPGTATEQDVISIEASENRLCELVDGVLVEKPLGYEESLIANAIGTALSNFIDPRRLGWISAPDGMMRVIPGQVRMPDVAYVSRERAPGGRRPKGPIADLSPDLAVEVLSESNTVAEIDRKRREYFEGGTQLVWIVDPAARMVAVYTQATVPDNTLSADQTLDGGDVLPGFTLELATLFKRLDD